MSSPMDRREFLRASAAAGAGLSLAAPAFAQTAPADDRPVRVGVIGVGGRGRGLLGILLALKEVRVPALCDVDPSRLESAREAVAQTGQPRPDGYSDGEHAYRKLLARDDVDAVVIATPWEWHTPIAVEAMKAGKYAASEVPCATTMEQCWELVNTHEATGVPCMMLENWSFRQDNLAVLNMIRQGLFGEIVHCHCAHSHNCIDHWYWDTRGNPRWPAKYLERYNRDQYPTHSLGPVLSWMDVPCGDMFAYATATATASLGINAHFARLLGPGHPMAKKEYPQGDIVTTVVKTHKGRTIVINNDMQLPRPYDNRWLIQGTLGLYDEERSAVYIHGKSPQPQTFEPFAPYQEKHDHAWYRKGGQDATAAGHGGTDYLELREFVRAVRNRTQTPLDVYESVLMSVIVPLSEQSIAKGSVPVECPDFTRGKWKTRKPSFAVQT